MSHPVQTLLMEDKVGRIYDILKTYPYDGFPIVDEYLPDLVNSAAMVFFPQQ